MTSLQELGNAPDEEIPSTPISDLPEPSGGFLGAEELQTGWHTFVLPSEDGFDFDVSGRDSFNNGAPVLEVRFGKYDKATKTSLGKPLRVEGKVSGLYGCRITTQAKNHFGKTTSNVDLLLQALGATEIPTTALKKAQALASCAGKKFRAKMKLNARFTLDRNSIDQRYESWVNTHKDFNGVDPITSKGGNVYFPIPQDENGRYPGEITLTEINQSTRVWTDFDQFGKV